MTGQPQRVFPRSKHPYSDIANLKSLKRKPSIEGDVATSFLPVESRTPYAWIQLLKAAIGGSLPIKSYTELPAMRQWASKEMESTCSPNLGSSERSAMVACALSNYEHVASLLYNSDIDAIQLVEEAEELLMQAERTMLICSPIRALPPEVLGHIFVDVCHDRYFFDLLSPFPNPLLRVCRRWRTIAFNTPRLWAQIDLDMATEHCIGAGRLDHLDAFVSRAKSTPLDISFKMFETEKDLADEITKRTIAASLQPAAGRVFGSLDFTGRLENLSTLLASRAGHSLQHLTITLRVRSVETLPAITLHKLRSLHIYGLDRWAFIHSFEAPALSTLSLEAMEEMPLAELGRMSSRFPQVTVLYIKGFSRDKATELQFLQLLECDWLTDPVPTYDMRLFGSTAQLTQLTINYDGQLSFTSLTPLLSLQTLRLCGRADDSIAPKRSDPGVAEILLFLKCCPNVTEIHLIEVNLVLGDALLRHLQPPDLLTHPPECTALQHLILDDSPVSLLYLDTFMKKRNRVANGQEQHMFYDTWAPCCRLSTRGFLISPKKIAFPDMDRATLSEVQASLVLLPETLELYSDASGDHESEDLDLCADCGMPLDDCECDFD